MCFARYVMDEFVGYSDTMRTLVAWCELRNDFRHFRTDRIREAELLDLHRIGPAELRRRWMR